MTPVQNDSRSLYPRSIELRGWSYNIYGRRYCSDSVQIVHAWCQSRMRFSPAVTFVQITSASATVHRHRPAGSRSSTGGVILSLGYSDRESFCPGESLYPLTPAVDRIIVSAFRSSKYTYILFAFT